MKTILVIARNGAEAEAYIKTIRGGHPETLIYYAYRPLDFYGKGGVTCHLIGRYYEHPDWASILQVIEERGFTCAEVYDWE